MAELNRTLALVRPVGMSDDMASDWLAAALAETMDMSDVMFAEGCSKARRECTHHAQIIPAIRSRTAELDAYRMQMQASGAGFLRDWRGAQPALAHDNTAAKMIADAANARRAS